MNQAQIGVFFQRSRERIGEGGEVFVYGLFYTKYQSQRFFYYHNHQLFVRECSGC